MARIRRKKLAIILTGLALFCAVPIFLMARALRSWCMPPEYPNSTTRYSWKKTDVPPGEMIIEIAIGSDADVFASRMNGEMLRSRDHGLHWSSVGLVAGGAVPRCVCVDSEDRQFLATNKGVYRSMDGGTKWHACNTGLADRNVSWIHAEAGGRLYAAGPRGRVYVSVDHGDHWRVLRAGGGDSGDACSVCAFPDGRTFVGTADKGIFLQTEPDGKWQQVYHAEQTGTESYPCSTIQKILPADGHRMVAQDCVNLLRSDDDGRHWYVADGLWGYYDLAADPGGGIVAGLSDGVYRSRDYGYHWETLSAVEPVPGAPGEVAPVCARSIAVDGDGRVFVGTEWGNVIIGTPIKE